MVEFNKSAKHMQVDVVSAEKMLYAGSAEMVTAPAVDGEVGILPGHAQMLCRLRPGLLRVKVPGREEEETIYVSGGILEVQPHIVTVLSDTAERAHDLDEVAANEARRRAEQAMADRQMGMDYARAQAELAEAVAQLRIIEQLRRGRKS